MDMYINWRTALTECRVTGGDLVSILDRNENEFVYTMMQNGKFEKLGCFSVKPFIPCEES